MSFTHFLAFVFTCLVGLFFYSLGVFAAARHPEYWVVFGLASLFFYDCIARLSYRKGFIAGQSAPPPVPAQKKDAHGHHHDHDDHGHASH